MDKLNLSGSAVEWKGTTWEEFLKDCKYTMDRTDDSDNSMDAAKIDTTVVTTGFVVGDESNGNLKAAVAVPTLILNEGKKGISMTSAVEAEAGVNEYEVQLGFAYWVLGDFYFRFLRDRVEKESSSLAPTVGGVDNAIAAQQVPVEENGEDIGGDERSQTKNVSVDSSRSGAAKGLCGAKIFFNRLVVLEEAERVLKLASSYFEGKIFVLPGSGSLLEELALTLQEVINTKSQVLAKQKEKCSIK
jgi:hypothetical protein